MPFDSRRKFKILSSWLTLPRVLLLIAAIMLLTLARDTATGRQAAQAAETIAQINSLSSTTTGEITTAQPGMPWHLAIMQVNPVDDTKIETYSVTGVHLIGSQTGGSRQSNLIVRLCDGQPCGELAAPAIHIEIANMPRIDSLQERHTTPIRIRFDKEPPRRQNWKVESYRGQVIAPNEQELFREILAHSQLAIEYESYDSSKNFITFNISHLSALIGASPDSRPAPRLRDAPAPRPTRQALSAQPGPALAEIQPTAGN